MCITGNLATKILYSKCKFGAKYFTLKLFFALYCGFISESVSKVRNIIKTMKVIVSMPSFNGVRPGSCAGMVSEFCLLFLIIV